VQAQGTNLSPPRRSSLAPLPPAPTALAALHDSASARTPAGSPERDNPASFRTKPPRAGHAQALSCAAPVMELGTRTHPAARSRPVVDHNPAARSLEVHIPAAARSWGVERRLLAGYTPHAGACSAIVGNARVRCKCGCEGGSGTRLPHLLVSP
jgi:hypothetical protein